MANTTKPDYPMIWRDRFNNFATLGFNRIPKKMYVSVEGFDAYYHELWEMLKEGIGWGPLIDPSVAEENLKFKGISVIPRADLTGGDVEMVFE